MPCNTIQTAVVELGKVNEELLALAMKELGVRNYSYRNGALSIYGDARTLTEVKQMYAKQVVFSQAKKYGWKVNEVKPFTYTVTKR